MTLRQFLSIVEIRTKLVSLSTFGIATLFALGRQGRVELLPLALAFPAVLLVDMGTTAFNAFFDYWRGVDEASTNREGDKVLLREGVPALTALFVGLGCFAGAAGLGLALAFQSGFWVLGAGVLSLIAGFGYNGGPRPVSHTPFGELLAGGFLGSFLFLMVYRIAAGRLDGFAVAAALPGFLMVASILSTNNACDVAGDRGAGRRTLAIVLGERRRAWPIYILGGLGFSLTCLLAALGVYPWTVGLCSAVSAAFAVPEYLALSRRGYSHETKSRAMGGILRIFLAWTLGLALGLALGLLFR